MSLPPVLQQLQLPVIGAPMFIAGNPKLVIEQCLAGIVGSFPALNARPKETLDAWLTEIESALAAAPGAAPYAVNQIVHKSNDRLAHDLEVCVRHKVPVTITSLRAPDEVVKAVHAYGGIVLHDVISVRHAEKKVWRDIWSAGQGVGQIDNIQPVREVVARLAAEYDAARRRLQFN